MSEVIANKAQAQAKINKLKDEAYKKITEATELADKWGVTFHWDLAYGMGGTYYPQHNDDSKWEESDMSWSPSSTENGWYSSSQSC